MPNEAEMGHVYTPVTFIGPSGESQTLTMLVDTGASYTWISEEILRALDVRPLRPRRFRLGDGRVIERQLGEVVVEIQGDRATTIVVFGQPGDVTVLGVYALEGVALEVDPAEGVLRPMELLFLATA